MGHGRAAVTRQFDLAQQDLAGCAERLQAEGVDAKDLARQPAWRTANARVRQLAARVRRVGDIESTAAALQERKSQAAGGDEE